MITNIKTGLSNTLRKEVTMADCAKEHGSGSLNVFATPAMIALMEKTSMEMIQQFLPDGFATVGIKINVDHVKATKPGSVVECFSILRELDNKRLVFEVNVTENKTIIGSGTHERYIIDENKFMQKLS